MVARSFSATIDRWVAETKERMVAVRNIAAERTIEDMQTPVAKGGNMPVKTNFLRASLQATIGDSLPPVREKPEGVETFNYGAGQVTLILARADLGDVITVAYTANYAKAVNYGARGRPARMFVELAAQRWPRHVDEAARYVRSRAGG